MKYLKFLTAAFVFATLATAASAHEHHAPHKGTLVEFGEEFAHLELVIDSTSGKISGYVLDGEAEKPVRIPQKDITLKITKEEFSVVLKAVANELSGEKEGDTSEFSGQSDKLKALKNFDALVLQITVKGKEFKDIKFNFPKGNE